MCPGPFIVSISQPFLAEVFLQAAFLLQLPLAASATRWPSRRPLPASVGPPSAAHRSGTAPYRPWGAGAAPRCLGWPGPLPSAGGEVADGRTGSTWTGSTWTGSAWTGSAWARARLVGISRAARPRFSTTPYAPVRSAVTFEGAAAAAGPMAGGTQRRARGFMHGFMPGFVTRGPCCGQRARAAVAHNAVAKQKRPGEFAKPFYVSGCGGRI